MKVVMATNSRIVRIMPPIVPTPISERSSFDSTDNMNISFSLPEITVPNDNKPADTDTDKPNLKE